MRSLPLFCLCRNEANHICYINSNYLLDFFYDSVIVYCFARTLIAELYWLLSVCDEVGELRRVDVFVCGHSLLRQLVIARVQIRYWVTF
jgi:hypothetical protein